MRHLRLKHSIPARPWVRRWMLVVAYAIQFIPSRFLEGIRWGWQDAQEHADQWKIGGEE